MIKTYIEKLDANSALSLSLVGFIGTVGLLALVMLPVLVGTYIDYLGFAEDSAGWVSAINIAGIALMTLVVSLKAKHWSLTKVATNGLIVMITIDVLTLFIHSIEIFALLRFISGLGGGAVQAAVAAAIARTIKSDKGFGIWMLFQFLMPAIGLFCFPLLLPDIGFNGMFIILISLEVISLMFVSILSKYRLPHHKKSTTEEYELALMLKKPALLSIFALSLYGAANAAIWAYADRIGINSGLSFDETGLVLSVTTAIAIFGALLVIWIKDKWGHLKPLSIGVSIQIIAMLIMVYVNSSLGYIIGIALYNICWAFAWPYFLSIQAKLDDSGTVVVAGQFSNLVGNAIGPAMAAIFVGSGGNYISAIWMACGLFIFSLLPIMEIYRTHKEI